MKKTLTIRIAVCVTVVAGLLLVAFAIAHMYGQDKQIHEQSAHISSLEASNSLKSNTIDDLKLEAAFNGCYLSAIGLTMGQLAGVPNVDTDAVQKNALDVCMTDYHNEGDKAFINDWFQGEGIASDLRGDS